jgi:hypothetical protein
MAFITPYSREIMHDDFLGNDVLDYNESETWMLSDSEIDETSYPAPAGYYNGVMTQNSDGIGYVVLKNGELYDADVENLERLILEISGKLPVLPPMDDETHRQKLLDVVFDLNYVTIG